MILGFGLDLCALPRIEKAISSERFLQRIYTQREQARLLMAEGRRRIEIAAGLYAAKEAVAKALGTGFSGFGPWDIEIAPDDTGHPQCALFAAARARADRLCSVPGRWRIHLSISHEADTAAAAAILEE